MGNEVFFKIIYNPVQPSPDRAEPDVTFLLKSALVMLRIYPEDHRRKKETKNPGCRGELNISPVYNPGVDNVLLYYRIAVARSIPLSALRRFGVLSRAFSYARNASSVRPSLRSRSP